MEKGPLLQPSTMQKSAMQLSQAGVKWQQVQSSTNVNILRFQRLPCKEEAVGSPIAKRIKIETAPANPETAPADPETAPAEQILASPVKVAVGTNAINQQTQARRNQLISPEFQQKLLARQKHKCQQIHRKNKLQPTTSTLVTPPAKEKEESHRLFLYHGIEITKKELLVLNEGKWLNDTVIEFYCRYLFHEKLSPEYREQIYPFSTFFYSSLTSMRHLGNYTTKTIQDRRYEQIKKWTKNDDIFEKIFLVIPINQDYHWYLAIIFLPNKVPLTMNGPQNKSSDRKEIRPCMYILNSGKKNENDYEKQADNFRFYLEMEWNTKKNSKRIFDQSSMKAYIVKCPQQNNSYDCGVFLLKFIEIFFENPAQFEEIPDLRDSFDQKDIKRKRNEIKEILMNLEKKSDCCSQD